MINKFVYFMTIMLLAMPAMSQETIKKIETKEKPKAEAITKVEAKSKSDGSNVGSETIITAEHMTFNYKKYIAVFEKNVLVVDPQMRMTSDRLVVLFDSTNDVKAVTALGSVKIWAEDKTASCDKAVYVAKTGEVKLYENAKLNRGKDSVSGDKITFWMNDDRMECIPGTLVIYPKKGQKGLIPEKKGNKKTND